MGFDTRSQIYGLPLVRACRGEAAYHVSMHQHGGCRCSLSCVVRIVADGLCLALPYLGDIFADTKPEALIEPGHTTAIGQGHRDSVSIDAVWRSVSAHLWPPPAHSAKGDNVLQGLMPPLTALIPGWLPTPDPLQCGDSKHNEKNT